MVASLLFNLLETHATSCLAAIIFDYAIDLTDGEAIGALGDMKLVVASIQAGIDIDNMLCGAASAGHEKIVDWLLMKLPGNFAMGRGIYLACRGGHGRIGQKLIDGRYKPNGRREFDAYGYYDNCLEGACEGGHTALVRTILADWPGKPVFNAGLRGACRGGRAELARAMLVYGASNRADALLAACSGGSLELLKMMAFDGNGSKTAFHWEGAISNASSNGHQHIVDHLLATYPLCDADLCAGVVSAWNNGHTEIGTRLIAAVDDRTCDEAVHALTRCMKTSIRCQNIDEVRHLLAFSNDVGIDPSLLDDATDPAIIRLLIESGHINPDFRFIHACRIGALDIINAVSPMVKYNLSALNKGLAAACLGRHIEAAQLTIKLGATDMTPLFGCADADDAKWLMDAFVGDVTPWFLRACEVGGLGAMGVVHSVLDNAIASTCGPLLYGMTIARVRGHVEIAAEIQRVCSPDKLVGPGSSMIAEACAIARQFGYSDIITLANRKKALPVMQRSLKPTLNAFI